ncbi:MAG: hypothetical protein JWQ49_6540 [Edaphobacter sp.]|nr:hypothetical protein [Edaphobacter sp.]
MDLTKTASLEYFRKGIRVNAENPGIIDNPFQDRVWGSEQAKQDFAKLALSEARNKTASTTSSQFRCARGMLVRLGRIAF